MIKNALTDAIKNTRKDPLLFNLEHAKKDLEDKWNNKASNQEMEQLQLRYNHDCTKALGETSKLAKVLHILGATPYPEKVLMELDYEKVDFIAQKIIDLELAYLFETPDYKADIEAIKASDISDHSIEMAIGPIEEYISNEFRYAINSALNATLEKINPMMEGMYDFEYFINDTFYGKVELSEETNQKMSDNYSSLLNVL